MDPDSNTVLKTAHFVLLADSSTSQLADSFAALMSVRLDCLTTMSPSCSTENAKPIPKNNRCPHVKHTQIATTQLQAHTRPKSQTLRCCPSARLPTARCWS